MLPRCIGTLLLAVIFLEAVFGNGALLRASVKPFSVPVAEAAAGIYKPIPYQGKMALTAGTAVADGRYNMRFKIFTVSTGGDPVWTETWNLSTQRVTMTGGLFSVLLGTHVTMTGSVDFNSDSLYLQVEFDPGNDNIYEETFSPRRRFASVPYAHNADKLDGLDAYSFIRRDADSTASGRITITNAGIGLNVKDTASGKILHAGSELRSSGTLVVETTGLFHGILTSKSTISGANLTVMAGADSYIMGKLGIGTSTPEEKLEIIGTASGLILHAQDLLRSSGSLIVDGSSVYFNSFANCTALETVNGLLTCGTDDGGTITAGQGITVNGSVVSLSSSFSGTALEILGTASGRILHAQDVLRSSGSLIVDGSSVYFNSFANCTALETVNGLLTCGSDDGTSYFAGQGLTLNGSNAFSLSSSFSGTALEIMGTASGRILHAQDLLRSSGSLIVQTTGLFKGNLTTRGTLSGAALTIMSGNSYLLGNVGIGTTTPETKLEIIGTASGRILHAQDILRSSGSLIVDGSSVYFNSFANCTALETINGLLTCGADDGGTVTAAQGLTLVSAGVLRLSDSFSGTALEIMGTASGRILHAQDILRSSGRLLISSRVAHPLVSLANSGADTAIRYRQMNAVLTEMLPGSSSSGSSTQTNDASNGGFVAWEGLGKANESDNIYVTAPTLYSGEKSYYLVATGFKLNTVIPQDAIIQGISVRIERSASVSNELEFSRVRLVRGGQIVTPDKAYSGLWGTTDVIDYFGNENDLWGQSWDPNDFDSEFGVAIAVQNSCLIFCSGSIPQIDHIVIEVSYEYPERRVGSSDWTSGIDLSDQAKFKISASDTLGLHDVITFTRSGSVGLGTASPGSSKLSVSGAMIVGSRIGSAAADLGITLEIIGTASGRILHAQDVLRSSGSLIVDGASIYFNSFANCSALETINGLLTCGTDDGGTVTAGQGITANGSVVSLSSSFSGTALEIMGTASGRILHAQDVLRSSGSLIVDGSSVYFNSFTNCTALETNSNGQLVCGTDDVGGGSVTAAQGLTLVSAGVLRLSDSFSGTALEIMGTASGRHLHAQDLLTSSGILVVRSSVKRASGAIVAFSAEYQTGAYLYASGATVLALNNYTQSKTGGAPLAPHIMFGYRGTFDTNLYRASGSTLQTDDKFILRAEDAENRELLRLDTEESTGTQNVFMIISDVAGNEDKAFRIQANGATFSDGAYSGAGADYAEWFKASTKIAKGELVCIDVTKANTVRRCHREADANLMGIVSSNPAFVGNVITGADGIIPPGYVLVGLIGQVPAKVVVESGASIRPGDALTAASRPGFARGARAGEPTVGVALEGLAHGEGVVNVLISRRNSSLTVDAVEEKILKTVAAMEIEDEVQIMVQQTLDAFNLDAEVAARVRSEVETMDLQASVNKALASQRIEQRISVLERARSANNNSTSSGLLVGGNVSIAGSLRVLGPVTLAQELSAASGIATAVLTVSGSAVIHDLTASRFSASAITGSGETVLKGNVRIEGSLLVNGVSYASVTPVGSVQHASGERIASDTPNLLDLGAGTGLTLDQLLVKGAFAVLGDLTIDGMARFLGDVSVGGNLTISGSLIVNRNQAGFALIPQTGSSVTVRFDPPFTAQPVVTISSNSFDPHRIRAQSKTGFTIEVPYPLTASVIFSWHALAVSDPRTVEGTGSTIVHRIPFPVDHVGYPVSHNEVWNACIRNRTLLDAEGKPYSCSRYHVENVWTHPDLLIEFTWRPELEPKLMLPEGFEAVVQQQKPEESAASSGVSSGDVDASSTSMSLHSSNSSISSDFSASSEASSVTSAVSSFSSKNQEVSSSFVSSTASSASDASSEVIPEGDVDGSWVGSKQSSSAATVSSVLRESSPSSLATSAQSSNTQAKDSSSP
jgi:hypothetical protein